MPDKILRVTSSRKIWQESWILLRKVTLRIRDRSYENGQLFDIQQKHLTFFFILDHEFIFTSSSAGSIARERNTLSMLKDKLQEILAFSCEKAIFLIDSF